MRDSTCRRATAGTAWSPRRSIGGTVRSRVVSGHAPPASVDRGSHRASLRAPRWRTWLGDSRRTCRAVDECDSADLRPVARRRCQRRDDAATAPRTTVAAAVARTCDRRVGSNGTPAANIPDGTPDGVPDGAPDGSPGDDTPDGVPAPGLRTDMRRESGAVIRTVADSGPASGRSCMADRTADSTNGSSIPATWSQAGPGSRGGS